MLSNKTACIVEFLNEKNENYYLLSLFIFSHCSLNKGNWIKSGVGNKNKTFSNKGTRCVTNHPEQPGVVFVSLLIHHDNSSLCQHVSDLKKRIKYRSRPAMTIFCQVNTTYYTSQSVGLSNTRPNQFIRFHQGFQGCQDHDVVDDNVLRCVQCL